MRNKLTLICILLTLTWFAFGEDLDGQRYYGDRLHFEFSSFQVDVSGYEEFAHLTGAYDFKLEYDNRIPYLTIYWPDPVKYVALFNDLVLYLWEADKEEIAYVGASRSSSFIDLYGFGKSDLIFSASSFYQRSNESYPPENLGLFQLFYPWVEGSTGTGIGDYLIIEDAYYSVMVSNGFVSYCKPELYLQNGRVRELQIENLESNEVTIFELQDSPHPQEIILPGGEQDSSFKITIISVYEGSLYSDICINFID